MRLHYRPLNRAVTGAVAALAATLSLAAAMPGVAVAAATTTWRTDGYGPGNTGYNPIETTINTDTVDTVDQRWSAVSPVVRDSCMRQHPPVVANNRLFTTDQGGVAAYNATTGAPLWAFRDGSMREDGDAGLTVYGSRLFVASVYCRSVSDPSADVRAFDAATGSLLWRVDFDGPVRAMVVDKDVLVVSGQDFDPPATVAYRLTDGAVLWEKAALLPSSVSANGRLLLQKYDADENGLIGSELVDIRTGAPLWSSDQTWQVLSSGPAGGPLYVTNWTGDLVRLNVETGATAWSVAGAAGAFVSVDGPRLYVAQDRQLVVRDSATGAQVWSRSFTRQLGKPVIAGGVVYATESGSNVHPLDAANGAALDPSVDPPYAGAVGHPVVVNGRLYVTNGRVLDAYTP